MRFLNVYLINAKKVLFICEYGIIKNDYVSHKRYNKDYDISIECNQFTGYQNGIYKYDIVYGHNRIRVDVRDKLCDTKTLILHLYNKEFILDCDFGIHTKYHYITGLKNLFTIPANF
jgi:hypothetical protein